MVYQFIGYCLLLLALVGRPLASRAQLVPVPLAERVLAADLVVEVQVGAATAERRPDGHLATRHALTAYKVFKGQLPAAGTLSVLTPGGTLGLRREDVSHSLALGEGQQGVLLLEADPDSPGSYWAAGGAQGFVAYDLATGTATEPFGRYPALAGALYPALSTLVGQPWRAVQPNAALAAADARRASAAAGQRLAATPSISDFSPGSVAAGVSTSTSASTSAAGVLTISGTGFNAAQGSGYVEFRNADNGGGSYVQPLASDYLLWSDTQVQVRVPSRSSSGNAAGTGTVRVTNSDGNTATSGTSLTVPYALSNVTSSSMNYRSSLVSDDGSGGYTLQYGPSVPTAAQAPFEVALSTWRCQAGANRSIGAATTTDAATSDGVNVVRFGTLSSGVLGVTNSYYSGCYDSNNVLSWTLVETDYSFSSAANWNFAASAPGGNQYDFQSVALHEQGHGIQLAHIISGTGVMNYAIGNGQSRRTLDGNADLAAAADETNASTAATAAQRCNAAVYATSSSGCTLPVQLVAFTAHYAPGQGTTLGWATASEESSAYFAPESQADGQPWLELARLPAAGSSAARRQYQYLDPRPLAGTRYYRLRQVDADGAVAYSPTVAVQAAPAATLAAYPNPATGTVQLSGPLAAGASAQVQVLDALGRLLRRTSGPAGQASFELPLTDLPPGLYVLRWDGGLGGVRRLRLVVE